MANKFTYKVTFNVTSETEIKAKDLKRAVQIETEYVFVKDADIKIGKVTVAAA